MPNWLPRIYAATMRKNRVPTVMTVIIPQPGANHIEIADEAYKRVDQLKKDLPEDVSVDITFDNTRFIRASINEVRDTIFIAFALVVFIIFFFLARLESNPDTCGGDSHFADRCLFYYVPGRLFH